MKSLRESKAMEEVRELKRLCDEEFAHLPDDVALGMMIERAAEDAREVEKEIARLRETRATLDIRIPS